jgi:hypothetical protein
MNIKRNEMVHIESKLTNYLNNNNLESKIFVVVFEFYCRRCSINQSYY